jgi:hypothetical protein
MAVTIICANWMVAGAIGIARWLSISKAIIGLTVQVRSRSRYFIEIFIERMKLLSRAVADQ